MTYSDFLEKCCQLPIAEKELELFIYESVLELRDIAFEESEIEAFCKKNIEKLSNIAPGVKKCISVCLKIDESKFKRRSDSEFAKVRKCLERIRGIIDKVTQQDEEENAKKEQNTSYKTAIDSFEKKLVEMQEKLESVTENIDKRLETADNKLENRTVSVLMNTVSILALFVAIAFAGFGTFSIFGEVSLDFAESYFKSITTLFVVALLTYNLILILLYFVCKIALNDGEKLEKVKLFGKEFFKSLFFWIDVILFVTIAVLFVLISTGIIV